MAAALLELNDTDLTVHRDGRVVAAAPGLAVIHRDRVLLGHEALEELRLHPRQSNPRFWHRLNQDPLEVRGPNAANHADLVFLQLTALARQADLDTGQPIIVATPAIIGAEQLALLLGIAREAGVTVGGLVDAAVAAASGEPLPERLAHVDVSLNRFTITRLAVDDQVRREGADEVVESGLLPLIEGWVNVVADRFVAQTRYDPLHDAGTEQQLFSQIYDWLTATTVHADLTVSIRQHDQLRQVEVSAGALIEKAAQRYQPLIVRLAGIDHVALGHRAARLPGLTAELERAGKTVLPLAPESLADAVARHEAAILSEPDAVKLITRLPGRRSTVAAAETEPPPTHALIGADAMPIDAALTIDATLLERLGIAPADPGASLTVERDARGVTAAGQHVEKGARLDVGGTPVVFIRVRDGT